MLQNLWYYGFALAFIACSHKMRNVSFMYLNQTYIIVLKVYNSHKGSLCYQIYPLFIVYTILTISFKKATLNVISFFCTREHWLFIHIYAFYVERFSRMVCIAERLMHPISQHSKCKLLRPCCMHLTWPYLNMERWLKFSRF